MPRVIALTLVAALALLPAGCGKHGVTSETPGGGQAVGSSPSATAAATTPAATPATAEFPKTARAYAESVLAAWKQHQLEWLGDLTTPQVQEQIIEIPGPPNQSWTYHTCNGAAGSTFCEFFNANGDAIVLRVTNSLLGKAHAVAGVTFQPTTYPNNAEDYVKAFIKAWQDGNRPRMLALANQNEVDYFTHYTPPENYSTCGEGAMGSTYVRVYNSDGLNYTIRVVNQFLGQKHAISEHTDITPSCT